MLDEKARAMLEAIRETLDEKTYPESLSILNGCDDHDTLFDIASQLHDADGTRPLAPAIAAFVKAVYLDEIERGDARAECSLGSLYYTGRAGEQSYEKAVHYYTLAAEHGEPQAQENLGYCYYYGRDVEIDYRKAYHYFIKGALEGRITPLYKIGDMYRYGYYVEKDEREAFRLYQRCYREIVNDSIDFSHSRILCAADIYLRMGDAYFEGIGTPVDNLEALTCYQRAERLFYWKLAVGDYFSRGGLKKAVERQAEARARLAEGAPKYDWTK